MKRALPALAALLLTACAGSWPANMPPMTYSGTVYSAVTGERVANAKVTANRVAVTPGLPLGLLPADPDIQLMVATTSNRRGEFTLTTTSGYAEWLEAVSPDGTLAGQLDKDLKKSGTNLVIELQRK